MELLLVVLSFFLARKGLLYGQYLDNVVLLSCINVDIVFLSRYLDCGMCVGDGLRIELFILFRCTLLLSRYISTYRPVLGKCPTVTTPFIPMGIGIIVPV